MKKIKIICESMSDLPDNLQQEYDVELLPINIVFDGKEYKSGVDISTNDFYKMIRNSKSMPTTSQITYANFKEIFEGYLKEDNIVLYMSGSSAASGTYQSATLAKNDIESDDIYVFDTFSISIGGGILVQKAAEMVKQGHDIDYVINKLEEYKNKVHVFFSVDTLDYLQKGGRISSTKATIGTLLNIKPILNIEDGLVKQKGQVRGTKKIMPALIENIKSVVDGDFSNKDVYVGYGDDLSIKDELVEKVKKELSPRNVYTFQIGSCVASHSGPNVFGIACIDV